jgi:hypothetical protein
LKAQDNFAKYGASELRWQRFVRKPSIDDRRDGCWRPIDLARDMFDSSSLNAWPESLSRLYYWRSDYWLRDIERKGSQKDEDV